MTPLKLDLICQKVLEKSFFLLFFLTPLIFTTINHELFEFNKMVFVYLVAVVILTFWIIKMIIQKKIIFQKTFLFWPLMVFLLSQIITTITSIDPHISFWGYYTRQNGGLLSITAYILLYFALVSNLNSPKININLLKASLAALIVVSIYGLLQRLGIDDRFWVQDVSARIFSSLGQPNWLAAWISSLIFLIPAFFTQKKSKGRFFFIFVFLVAFLALIFTRSRSGFLAFGLVYFFILFLSILIRPIFKSSYQKVLVLFGGFSFILTVLFLSPFEQINRHFKGFSLISPQSLPQWETADSATPDLGSATADIRKVVWQGAIQVFKNHPFLGTGPETFAHSYYWHQPKDHNLLSEWDFLYNKAHNEYLNYLANTGLVGFGAYFILIIATLVFLFASIKKDPKNFFLLGLFAGYLTILITNFFGFSVVAVNLLFFLIPALVFTSNNQIKSSFLTSANPLSGQQKFALIIIILVGLNLILALSRYWLADYHLARGEKELQQGSLLQSYLHYRKAKQLNPKEPLYSNKLAFISAHLAVVFSQNQNNQEAENFTNKAKILAKKTIDLSPYQVGFYRQQSQTYFLLSRINPQYLVDSYQLLLAAHKLAPMNPKITYNLAVLAHQQTNLDQGIAWLKTSINLKPDYQDAYYWIARFYQENNQVDEAREALVFLLKYLNPDHREAQELLKQL